MAAAGLAPAFVEDHVLRCLYSRPQSSGAQLAAACGLPFQSGIGTVLDGLRQDHLVEIRGQRGIGDAGYAYVLTSKGTTRATEALERTQYQGPLPVSLDNYVASIEAQRINRGLVTPERMREAFADLLAPDWLTDKIGPSINSGSALFLFGSAGNGKTAMAERISRVLSDPIYIPHALEVDGYIVKLFDPLVHRPVQCNSTPGIDQRWVQIERPLVVAGGELTLAGLDLLWSDAGRFYEAPLQLKANGGVLLLDDFGRQQVRPADLLNRWIVPLEKHIDYLTLLTGKRLQVPFQQMLVFATNLEPADLADDAFLRRIRFKLRLGDPTPAQFSEIFQRECHARGVQYASDGLQYIMDRWLADRPLRMCQPRDLVEQIVAIADYRSAAPDITSRALLDEACESYFAAAA
ncbi:MAG: ATP-binding protein [Chloroflexi bacterium]|nr:ATP-binding protein [Chloroflexota bacterium]